MRKFITSIGRPGFVILLTLFAIAMAVGLSSLYSLVLGIPIETDAINRAIILPIIIAPVISWYLLGLFFELHSLENQLNQLVIYDQLTGLMSRRAFFESAEKAFALAVRHQQPLAVLALDLDYFKRINDNFGHQAGDKVLSNFGELVKDIVRHSDLVGRIGGEEFAFILPNTNLKQAKNFAWKIQNKLSQQAVSFKQSKINYSASIGISELDIKAPQNLEQLLYLADKALYQAKERGRNRIFISQDGQMIELTV